MKFRFASIPLSVLATTLALAPLVPALAQPPAPRARNPFTDPAPAGEGAPREGGPGGEGGGPRQPAVIGQRADETPEQYRQRVLAPYEEMVTDLTDAQRTHIMAIMEAVNAETRAIRADTSLTEERQRNASRALRNDVPNRIKNALTDEQLVSYTEMLNERANAASEMQKVMDAHPDEDIAATRERVTKGYEDFLEEISVKQKTQILKFLETADGDAAAINADATKTPAQKKEALLKIHNGLTAQILPLLDAEQAAAWKKAHDAKRPQ